jgi:hypothetical protein
MTEGMRWDDLFADLEASAQAEDRAALDAEVADRSRQEVAAIGVADRLAAHLGRPLTCWLRDGEPVGGVLRETGAGWLLLRVDEPAGDVLVPTSSVVALPTLGNAVRAGAGRRPLPLTVVLRGLARDRATVRIRLLGGRLVEGTIDRVGSDHIDLAEHPADEHRRNTSVRRVITVPLSGLLTLRVL